MHVQTRHLPVLLLLALLLAWAPLTGAQVWLADDTAHATIITYNVPITIAMNATADVPANGNATLSFELPSNITFSSGAQTYLSYSLNTSNPANISLSVTVNNQTQTIYLAAGSPSQATIPLAATPTGPVTVKVVNSNGNVVKANVTLTILDSAKFKVTVEPDHVRVTPGGQASVTVHIEETSGPAGTVSLNAYTRAPGVATSITPTTLNIHPGQNLTATWKFQVGGNAKPGNYQAYLDGVFMPEKIPGQLSGQVQYTFAEVMLPVLAGPTAAAGSLGFLAGTIAGWKMHAWAVLIAILLIAALLALLFRL